MQENLNINLGSVQAPYWENVITLQPKETHVVRYVYDSFNLLSASAPNVLEVTFGGAAVQSKFSAGMGYKLSQPVSYIQFFNTSDSPLTIDYSLAVGGITDNRLTVSGVVNTLTRIQAYSSVSAGTLTAPQNLTYGNEANVAVVCTSGTITINISEDNINVTNLVLSAGQSWELSLVSGGTIEITGTGMFNYNIAEY